MNRPVVRAVTAAVVLVVSACDDRTTTSPVATPAASDGVQRVSSPESDYWVGYTHGNFWIEIDPRVDNIITWDRHSLAIPRNTLCDPASSYGPSEWNKPCKPATANVRFTFKTTTSPGGHPRVDVLPHVRFNPRKAPVFIRLFDASADLDDLSILWCPTEAQQAWMPLHGGCIDESRKDRSLKTHRDEKTGFLYRRLKHFSGYEVAAT